GGLRVQGAQVDGDLLVVSPATADQVVAQVLDAAVRTGQVVEEDEVLVGEDPAPVVHHDRGRVEVIRRAGGLAHLPAKSDGHRGQVWRRLAQRDVAALGQGHRG